MLPIKWLNKLEPFGEPLYLQSQMNQFFDNFFGRDFLPESFRGSGRWRPAVDVSESAEAITVKAELPGIEANDVNVSLTGDILSIKGEKRQEKEAQGKNYHRIERSHGTFERVIKLPVAVKPDDVEATFKNGVLVITLPKKEEAVAKSVQVKIGE